MTQSAFESEPARPPALTPDQLRQRLVGLLSRPRYEVLPFRGTAEQVEQLVPTSLPVTVTSSPRRGLEPTLELTEALSSRGFSVVPHLAARLVYGKQHLAEVMARLQGAGVDDLFVVAGDSETPAGDFKDSLQLLTAILQSRQRGVAPGPARVGVAGYPEGHPLISDTALTQALVNKQPMSSYVVTQMCFDAGTVGRWIGRTREAGLRLPVHVGVPGAVDQLRLLKVARRIGVGDSVRFLRKHHGGANLVRFGGYRPDALIEELAAGPAVAGLHVYTLGDVTGTERWRQEMLDRLTESGSRRG